jgi:hypothetical protein
MVFSCPQAKSETLKADDPPGENAPAQPAKGGEVRTNYSDLGQSQRRPEIFAL